MNLGEIMNNPYAQLFLAICTVFSVFFAIYTRYESKEKKELSYTRYSYAIVRRGVNMIDNFQILYDGQSIDDLTVTRFAIWNSGNKLLNSTDIVDTKPLSFISKENGPQILDVSIIKQSEESNKFTINKSSPHCAEIRFDYLSKQEGVIVQIIHTGSAKNISLSCLIKGGKKLKNSDTDPIALSKKNYKGILTALVCIEMILISISVLLYTFSVAGIIDEGAINDFMKMNDLGHPFVFMIIFYSLFVMTAFVSYKIIKKLYHLNVPIALRDYIEYYK